MTGCINQARPCQPSKIEVYCTRPVPPKIELLDSNKKYYEEESIKRLMLALDSLEVYVEGLLSTIQCYEEATTKLDKKGN